MHQRTRTKSGQGIVEYAFCIAFIGILIALAFSLTRGSLFAGVSGSYSSVNGNLTQLNNASNPPSIANGGNPN